MKNEDQEQQFQALAGVHNVADSLRFSPGTPVQIAPSMAGHDSFGRGDEVYSVCAFRPLSGDYLLVRGIGLFDASEWDVAVHESRVVAAVGRPFVLTLELPNRRFGAP